MHVLSTTSSFFSTQFLGLQKRGRTRDCFKTQTRFSSTNGLLSRRVDVARTGYKRLEHTEYFKWGSGRCLNWLFEFGSQKQEAEELEFLVD
jgi:hypothetical protein